MMQFDVKKLKFFYKSRKVLKLTLKFIAGLFLMFTNQGFSQLTAGTIENENSAIPACEDSIDEFGCT